MLEEFDPVRVPSPWRQSVLTATKKHPESARSPYEGGAKHRTGPYSCLSAHRIPAALATSGNTETVPLAILSVS